MSAVSQSLTVDYQVAGPLDGQTAAPSIQRGLTPIDGDSQIYEPEPVDSLGLIDPDLGLGGSIGLRCISQLIVNLKGETAPVGSRIVVAAQKDDALVNLQEIADFSGESGVSVLSGFVVPQGAVLRLEGGAVAGGEPILVRISILAPADPCTMLALLGASAGGDASAKGDMLFSDDVVSTPQTRELSLGVIQRYDPSGVLADEIVFDLPAAPTKDQQVGIKEVGDSGIPVLLNGNGNNVETLTAPPAASLSSGLARQSLLWKFDGSGTWRAI
mgnify:FL=1